MTKKNDKFPGIFIRAPAILSTLPNETNPVRVMGEMIVPDNVQFNNLHSSGSIPPEADLTTNHSHNSNNIYNSNSNSSNGADRVIVAVQQGVMLATVFHPELTDDIRFHEYFVHIVRKYVEGKDNAAEGAKKGSGGGHTLN